MVEVEQIVDAVGFEGRLARERRSHDLIVSMPKSVV